MGISIKAYARHRNVSDTAVLKAIKTSRITTLEDGTIDPVVADDEWAKNTTPRKIGTSIKPEPQATTQDEHLPFILDTVQPIPKTPVTASFQQARTTNEIIKVETGKIKLSNLKGELLERQSVVDHVFKLARTERDAWLNWPARVSSQIAAKLGVDDRLLHIELEAAVRTYLQELSDITININPNTEPNNEPTTNAVDTKPS